MEAIGLAIVALGVIGIIFGIFQKVKAGRVADAPLARTGEVARNGRAVAGPKGQVSAQGNVVCHQPLMSPVTGTPCLYYELKVTAEWKEGEVEKTKVLDEQKMAAQFAIDDGTGPVWIDAREGGDFEPSLSKKETKGTGLLGGLMGGDVQFGNYKVQTGMLSLGTKYTVEEEVMPLTPQLYACGLLNDANPQGAMIASPTWRQLILSSKSRDALLSSATKSAKLSLIAGTAAFLLGGILCVTAELLDDGSEGDTQVSANTKANIALPPPPVLAPPPAATTPPTAVATNPAPATTTTTASVKKAGRAPKAKASKGPKKVN